MEGKSFSVYRDEAGDTREMASQPVLLQREPSLRCRPTSGMLLLPGARRRSMLPHMVAKFVPKYPCSRWSQMENQNSRGQGCQGKDLRKDLLANVCKCSRGWFGPVLFNKVPLGTRIYREHDIGFLPKNSCQVLQSVTELDKHEYRNWFKSICNPYSTYLLDAPRLDSAFQLHPFLYYTLLNIPCPVLSTNHTYHFIKAIKIFRERLM